MPKKTAPRRALLSVSDKDGIVEFARVLLDAGYEIISTGGTQKVLEDAGINVIHIEKITQFPEAFGGRVKTMHPLIMGGILYKREDKDHVIQAGEFGIRPIDIVVVNLYPFQTTIQKIGFNPEPGKALPEEAIEQIDIGGPTLIRSAAKNHSSVTVISDPSDYKRVSEQLQENGETTVELRRELATKAFLHTSMYDAYIAETMSGGTTDDIMLTNGRPLRYGENPHQWGKFFAVETAKWHVGATWKQLQGKEMSYLNFLDGDGAWRMACDFTAPTAVFVKHANPSGIASNDTIEDAFQKAYDTDRLSAFGVIIAVNRPFTKALAEKIIDQKIFVEVILAPTFEPSALEILQKKPNIRVLSMGSSKFSQNVIYRSAFGGMLVQNDDTREVTEKDLTWVTKKQATKEQIRDMLFAWKAVKHAKSNAIVLAKDQTTIGIGCGQTSRVDSTWIALKRAGEQAKGSVLASDAFFPFADSIEEAAKKGIVAVIQPGGSIRDAEVFKRADELGIAMATTGVRAFRH
jgi:phosphoribosylaminoimidazolecarboxamide formyltransferase/IMP cyclohydrolase